jgi:hypothetical protein
LKEMGYTEGQDVRIDYRWADGQYNKLPAFATELVQRHVAAIVTTGRRIGSQSGDHKNSDHFQQW